MIKGNMTVNIGLTMPMSPSSTMARCHQPSPWSLKDCLVVSHVLNSQPYLGMTINLICKCFFFFNDGAMNHQSETHVALDGGSTPSGPPRSYSRCLIPGYQTIERAGVQSYDAKSVAGFGFPIDRLVILASYWLVSPGPIDWLSWTASFPYSFVGDDQPWMVIDG